MTYTLTLDGILASELDVTFDTLLGSTDGDILITTGMTVPSGSQRATTSTYLAGEEFSALTRTGSVNFNSIEPDYVSMRYVIEFESVTPTPTVTPTDTPAPTPDFTATPVGPTVTPTDTPAPTPDITATPFGPTPTPTPALDCVLVVQGSVTSNDCTLIVEGSFVSVDCTLVVNGSV